MNRRFYLATFSSTNFTMNDIYSFRKHMFHEIINLCAVNTSMQLTQEKSISVLLVSLFYHVLLLTKASFHPFYCYHWVLSCWFQTSLPDSIPEVLPMAWLATHNPCSFGLSFPDQLRHHILSQRKVWIFEKLTRMSNVMVQKVKTYLQQDKY